MGSVLATIGFWWRDALLFVPCGITIAAAVLLFTARV